MKVFDSVERIKKKNRKKILIVRSHNTKGVISIVYKNKRFDKNVFAQSYSYREGHYFLNLSSFISTVKDSKCASILYISSSLFTRRRR